MASDEAGAATDKALRTRTGYLLIELGHHAKVAAHEALAPFGLRPRHISVLVALIPAEHEHPGLLAHGSLFPYHVLELDIPAGAPVRTPMALEVATEPLPAGTVSFAR